MNFLYIFGLIKNFIFGNKYITLLFGLLLVIGSAYFYYQHNQSKLEKLERKNETLNFQVEQTRKELDTLKKNMNLIIDSHSQLLKTREEGIKEKTKLESTLNRSKHKKSLEELALKKSNLIKNRINLATQEVMKCFEKLSTGDSKC